MKRVRFSGSYTVEASLLFTFIMSVIIFLIYMSFFLHDRCVMNQSAYQAALRGSRVKTEEGKVIGTAEKAADELIKDSLLATKDVSHTVTVDGSEVKVAYEGTLKIPAGVLFMSINGSSGIRVSGTGSAKRKDPIKFIRECRVIENLSKPKKSE